MEPQESNKKREQHFCSLYLLKSLSVVTAIAAVIPTIMMPAVLAQLNGDAGTAAAIVVTTAHPVTVPHVAVTAAARSMPAMDEFCAVSGLGRDRCRRKRRGAGSARTKH